jgi:GDPmannose 4,6-dehydratase
MWMMLQQDEPGDYVIATGVTHSVRDFLDIAFGHLGLDWRAHVEIDPKYFRPTEVDFLLGDPRKAEKHFGWKAHVGFGELVRMMVDSDVEVERTRIEGTRARNAPTI